MHNASALRGHNFKHFRHKLFHHACLACELQGCGRKKVKEQISIYNTLQPIPNMIVCEINSDNYLFRLNIILQNCVYMYTFQCCLSYIHLSLIPSQLLKLENRTRGLIPLKASLCSYKCFNSQDHEFYGIAAPIT